MSMLDSGSSHPSKHLAFINWKVPPDPWLKINCDGSVHLHHSAACGGLFCNSSVHFIRAFSANIGCCPVVVAELWGALYSLELAWSLEYHHDILELDSSSAILLLQKNLVHPPFSTLVPKIQELLSRNWEVKVQCIYREASRAADLL